MLAVAEDNYVIACHQFLGEERSLVYIGLHPAQQNPMRGMSKDAELGRGCKHPGFKKKKKRLPITMSVCLNGLLLPYLKY